MRKPQLGIECSGDDERKGSFIDYVTYSSSILSHAILTHIHVTLFTVGCRRATALRLTVTEMIVVAMLPNGAVLVYVLPTVEPTTR